MLLICVNAQLRAAEKGKGLGDGHDGNRSSISHVITLYDEKDVEIKPNVSQPRPISMRNTCGKCRDYDAMASGWHFHSGSTNALSDVLGSLGFLLILGSELRFRYQTVDGKVLINQVTLI